MLRKIGYALKGSRINFRGKVTRKERSSLLSVDGMLEVFPSKGTFDRRKFISCCRSFTLKSWKVFPYPRQNSIFIMDGASIHCDQILCIIWDSWEFKLFLPSYCPFFNPIELLFKNINSSTILWRELCVCKRNEDIYCQNNDQIYLSK